MANRRTNRNSNTTTETETENTVTDTQTEIEVPQGDTTTAPQAPKREIAAEIPFAIASGEFEFVPQTKGGAGRPRSEYQVELDNLVRNSYGKPFVALLVDADEKAVKDLTRRVRNSGEYLKLGIRVGELQPSSTDGKVVFMFRVTDKISRPRKRTAETPAE
jgi:hypothetical protein